MPDYPINPNSKANITMQLSKMVALQLASLSGVAQAGGLYVGEFGQPNQGASRAGAHALAEDASTAAQNPAGIMFLDFMRAAYYHNNYKLFLKLAKPKYFIDMLFSNKIPLKVRIAHFFVKLFRLDS